MSVGRAYKGHRAANRSECRILGTQFLGARRVCRVSGSSAQQDLKSKFSFKLPKLSFSLPSIESPLSADSLSTCASACASSFSSIRSLFPLIALFVLSAFGAFAVFIQAVIRSIQFGARSAAQFALSALLGPPIEEELRAPDRRRRLLAVDCGLLLLSLGIIGRLYLLQSSDYQNWERLASKQHDTALEVQGARGDILDSSGRTLATSVESVSIALRPKKVSNLTQVADALAPFVALSPKELSEKISIDKPFVWIARGLPIGVLPELTGLEELGIEPVREFRRTYPQGLLASSVLGRVSREGTGQSGIEHQFDTRLAAGNVRVPVRRDARGSFVSFSQSDEGEDASQFLHVRSLVDHLKESWRENWTNAPALDPSVPDVRDQGHSTVLTIDSVAQGIVEAEVMKAEQDTHAARVLGVVMDADTGAILALAQTPKFDPSENDVSPEALRNFGIQNNFEPGSTMKPLIAALALDKGVAHLSDQIDCEGGAFSFAGKTIRDVHPNNVISFYDVLVRSSNIGMSKIGARLGKRELYTGISKLGFGRITGVELPGEAKGILRAENNWADIDVATASFGQGVSVTALQIVRAYAAVANGGLLVKPHITQDSELPDPIRVFSEKAAGEVRKALQGVVEDEHGTGHNAQISGVKVYGKTGTAQKARESGRGYDSEKIFSSFIGFADARELGLDRRLVMFVGVDEPKSAVRYGGVLAAPVFSKSLQKIISHLLSTEGKVVQIERPGTSLGTSSREFS